MFDIGNIELFVILVVLVVFIKPEDLPIVLKKLGLFISKFRNVSYQLYRRYDDWVKLVELEDEISESKSKPKKNKKKYEKKMSKDKRAKNEEKK